ncbi:hypothetical protein [Clostridium mediterraneense]|uniref:hypothetical protein n=1 Tax=Clostridium mediterraneense TaxID=1805472 RepID=UPI0008369FFB|nr:hypothetical protein [Clostridium mediterraneense]
MNSNGKKPFIVSAAWSLGWMSIIGAIVSSLTGIILAIIAAIFSLIAILKYKENKKVLIPWIVALIISIIILIIFSHIGPVSNPFVK